MDDENEHSIKRRKPNSSKLQLPTRDELVHLRETENLFKSNLLKLQTTELLNEVRMTATLPSKVESWRNSIMDSIKRIKSINNIDATYLNSNKLSILKLVNPSTSIDFEPPTDINIVGSSKLNISTKPYLNIDIAVTIPEIVFDEQDVLNYVYFDKRKLYLGVIAKYLSEMDGNIISIGLFKSDPRKPIIIVQTKNFKTNYEIRIIPTITASNSGKGLKVSALNLANNNVRPRWWHNEVMKQRKQREEKEKNKQVNNKHIIALKEAVNTIDASKLIPTPNYNMCILEDMVINAHSTTIQTVINFIDKDDSCLLKDIILLLKVRLSLL